MKHNQSIISKNRNQKNMQTEVQKRSIFIKTIPVKTSESVHDKKFKNTIEAAAKLCYPYRHNSSKAKKVLDLLECGLLFGAENFIKNHNKKEATKLTCACFSPAKVLRQADQSEEGSFNLTGAGCFRAIQKLKKYKRGFLFS